MVCRTSIPGAVLGLGPSRPFPLDRGRLAQRMVRGYAVGITSRAP